MRDQKKVQKKVEKAKARHKDYAKKRNINANVPTREVVFEKPIFKQIVRKNGLLSMLNGKVQMQVVGQKTIRRKVKVTYHQAQEFPPSRKFSNFKGR